MSFLKALIRGEFWGPKTLSVFGFTGKRQSLSGLLDLLFFWSSRQFKSPETLSLLGFTRKSQSLSGLLDLLFFWSSRQFKSLKR